MKQIGKVRIVFALQIVCTAILIIKCFGPCAEFTLDRDSLNKSFEGDLTHFDDGFVGIESQSMEESELLNASLNLGSGAYSIKIMYDSVSSYDGPNIDNSTGRVGFSTENNRALRASEVWLHDGEHEADSRIWIRPGSGTNEVRVFVRYHGNGKLAIKSISIEEKRGYRITICIAAAFLFVVCDFLYFLFRKKDNSSGSEKTKYIVAGIIGITAFSSMTYIADFLYDGHDLLFHLSRISSLARGLREFQIPHRMQFEMLNGYGYAAPLYYGEIFLLLPAVLYNFYVPLQTCYQVFVVFVNLATCMISYWCFSGMCRDWRKGLLGSAMYTLAAYRLNNVMVRAAVGEFTAMIFFPLLVYGFYNIYNNEKDDEIRLKDYLPVILSATGIVNSHVLSCEMAVIFLVIFMALKYRKTFRKNIFQALIKCSAFTLLLNMWFIVPFLQSMEMKVKVTDKEYINLIEGHGVYLSQLFGIFHTAAGLSVGGAHNEMPLALGLPVLLGIAMFLYVCQKKEAWGVSGHKGFYASKVCFILGTIALFFSSNLCKWNNLKAYNETLARIAGMVQFPWRYLGIAAVCFITMVVFLLQIIEEHSPKKGREAMLLLAAAVIITEGHFMMEYVNAVGEIRIYSESSAGTMNAAGSGAEYLLQGTDLEGYKNRNILAEDGVGVTDFHYDKNGKYYLSCTNESGRSLYVDVPVQAYHNYHAYSNEGEMLRVIGENNRIRIYVPENFNDTICLEYRIPILWRICEAVSFITGCVIVFLLAFGRQKRNGKLF